MNLDDMKLHKQQTKGFDTGQMLRYYQEIERLKEEDRKFEKIVQQKPLLKAICEYDDAKEKELQKHLNTRLTVTLENFRSIFEEWNDNQRMEVIKSLIWTAQDAQGFAQKVAKIIGSDKFQGEID